ncbi:efflux RND transporter periplasmic adaptor subunit [Tateyamaria omphalii]|uniref:efflux RND transporter periplasmic adaptor subunit n=1 Tax=Tateyamaria omphalii TaxID=299262 RepID=UPI001C993546|nr:efflux RND transporter periplasmic adaptor subunit [Tateyamaria omphalii]MBY5933526.1 efflux RND transporter periplasmic adaptor subunit [Tateyamaria omphalii]
MHDENEASKREDVGLLHFEDDDVGARRSTWVAGGLVVLVIAWMSSGFFFPSENNSDGTAEAERQAIAVAVRTSVSESVVLTFQAEGQALPDRDTMIRAEASGDVAEVFVDKGQLVEADTVIARLSTEREGADVERAQEEVSRAQREFDNAQDLRARGVATEDRVSEARANLAAAQAQLVTAETALESTDIVAPFAGRLETMSLDEGEFIQAGAEVARLVDNQPLTVAIQVPQQQLTRIRDGQTATVTFITGEERTGRVTFVGSAASSDTRTFLTEIEVPNEDGAIAAGISAEVSIPTGEIQAHFISPSIVSLDPSGEIGVKTVEADRVVFYPVDVVRAEIDGIWVTGVPDPAEIITIGQGFVQNGEVVRAEPAIETMDSSRAQDVVR